MEQNYVDVLTKRYFVTPYRKTCNTTRGLYRLLALWGEGYTWGRVVFEGGL